MKKAIICALLLIGSAMCSSSTIENKYIDLWTSIFANIVEESSSKLSQRYNPNKNPIHSSPFNTPTAETQNHTPECASALDPWAVEQSIDYKHTDLATMEWQEFIPSSTQEPSYELQSAYQSGHFAQNTNLHSTNPNQYTPHEYLSLEEFGLWVSKYGPNRPELSNDQLVANHLNSRRYNALNSTSAAESNTGKQKIDYVRIKQTKKQSKMDCQKKKQREEPRYTYMGETSSSNTSQSIDYPPTASNPTPPKNLKRKAQDMDTEEEEQEEEQEQSKKQVKCNLLHWNENRLKDLHRKKCAYLSYKPASWSNNPKTPDNPRKELKEYVKKYKSSISTLSPITRLLFIISTRKYSISTKLVDCKYMAQESNNYKFMEEIHPNYSSISRGILEFMEKHGPIRTDRREIITEWNESLGDIYMRKAVDKKYLIDTTSILFTDTSRYNLLGAAVQMILGVPEIYFDLCKITFKFIQEVLRRDTKISPKDCTVVIGLYKIANRKNSALQSNLEAQYKSLYRVFADILNNPNISPENKVIHLYTRMYENLAHFYSKAEICREVDIAERKDKRSKEYALLYGKCMIKPQRYLKWTIIIDSKIFLEEHTFNITEETNKWSIKPNVAEHCHIHYVDNTAQRYKRLCMPLHKETGYKSTIGFIIEYITRVFKIADKRCIFPYKRDTKNGLWSSLCKEEMCKPIENLVGYHIVFYYIEEGLLESHFTFAQFNSYRKPEGEVVPIPLFLSPLARSLVETGPFKEKSKEHAIVSDMRFKDRAASVYAYKKGYKGPIYICIQHYYNNLYIRIDNADIRTADCYIMDAQKTEDTITWYVKVPSSIDEYTHCVLDKAFRNNREEYNALLWAVRSREYAPDSELYGFGVSIESSESASGTSQEIHQKEITVLGLNTKPTNRNTIPLRENINFMQEEVDGIAKRIKQVNEEIKVSEESKKEELQKQNKYIYSRRSHLKKKIEDLERWIAKKEMKQEETNITSFPFCSLLVFRNTNTTKSSLGAYNELFDGMLYRYSNFYKRSLIS